MGLVAIPLGERLFNEHFCFLRGLWVKLRFITDDRAGGLVSKRVIDVDAALITVNPFAQFSLLGRHFEFERIDTVIFKPMKQERAPVLEVRAVSAFAESNASRQSTDNPHAGLNDAALNGGQFCELLVNALAEAHLSLWVVTVIDISLVNELVI